MIEKERLHPDDQSNWHGWISYICGKWEIGRRYRPETILEIGVRTGYSAWAFLQVHPEAKYTGIDNFSYGDYPNWARENLLRGYDVDIRRLDTQSIDDLGLKADFIHVDGDHTEAGVMHDLDLALNALNPGGVILVDDYDRIPDVKAGVKKWLNEHPDINWKYCESFTGDILIGSINFCVSYNPPNETQCGLPLISETQKLDKGTLLVFHHGLGDLLLFLPLYEYLKTQGIYGLALQAGTGFINLVEGSIETPAGTFDYEKFCDDNGYESYQIVRFDMSEGSNLTKVELCARKEFGLEMKFEPKDFSNRKSRVIGVHFHGTCLPDQTNPDETTAKRIWQEIKAVGYIPLEIHFEHIFHNPANRKFDWVDRTTRKMASSVELLLAILKTCTGFVGVASGVWVAAVSCLPPGRICFLEKNHMRKNYFRQEMPVISIDNYKKGAVTEWLDMLS